MCVLTYRQCFSWRSLSASSHKCGNRVGGCNQVGSGEISTSISLPHISHNLPYKPHNKFSHFISPPVLERCADGGVQPVGHTFHTPRVDADGPAQRWRASDELWRAGGEREGERGNRVREERAYQASTRMNSGRASGDPGHQTGQSRRNGCMMQLLCAVTTYVRRYFITALKAQRSGDSLPSPPSHPTPPACCRAPWHHRTRRRGRPGRWCTKVWEVVQKGARTTESSVLHSMVKTRDPPMRLGPPFSPLTPTLSHTIHTCLQTMYSYGTRFMPSRVAVTTATSETL